MRYPSTENGQDMRSGLMHVLLLLLLSGRSISWFDDRPKEMQGTAAALVESPDSEQSRDAELELHVLGMSCCCVPINDQDVR